MSIVETVESKAIEEVHAFWLAGLSCDGCSISTIGATQPSAESLMLGTVPGVPKVILHHPVLSLRAGERFIENFRKAVSGNLGAPYVIIFEGSIADESIAQKTGGYWAGLGTRETEDGGQEVISTAEWLEHMAPNAAATIAIGTCATWGGVPAAAGNPTGAMAVMDFLGEDYRSSLGLPVVNLPGCAPQGDNVTETIAAILLYLQGIGPLPEFDELGRPAWLYGETVHRGCTRAGYYEEGVFAEQEGDKECLVEIGCWGPVVQCNINKRGAINHVGGCMNVGAPCIGCTMPGFPDAFSPFNTKPPGTMVSSTISRSTGFIVRNLRNFSKKFLNKTPKWKKENHVPSGWAHVDSTNALENAAHYFYEKIQFMDSHKPGSRNKKDGKVYPQTGTSKKPPLQADTNGEPSSKTNKEA